MKKLFSILSNLQTYYHFKIDFQNVDQYTGGKWLIHVTQHRKDNQLQTWNSLVENTSRDSKSHMKGSEDNMFNPIFKENVQGQKHPGRCAYLFYEEWIC